MFKLFSLRHLTINSFGQSKQLINSVNRFSPLRWKTYSAAVVEEVDKPLSIKQVPQGFLKVPGYVRVKVKYCSLNLIDVQRMTDINNKKYLPQIPGCEFAGEIICVGENTEKKFRSGDKCVALLDYDHRIGGGLAEESIVSETDCFPISISTKVASLAIQGHGTAFLAFTKFCELKKNDVVIVIAGSAGNGLAAVQTAKNVFRAKVYAICDTDDSSSVIRAEGAHKVFSVNEGLSNVYKSLANALADKKAKVVYDTVGQGLLYVAADFVDPEKGHFITIDPLHSSEKFKSTKPEFKKNKTKTNEANSKDDDSFVTKIKQVNLTKCKKSNPSLYEEIINDTLSLCEEEIIVPYISKTFGLSEVNKAVEFIKSKKCTGKVLIDIEKVEKVEKVEKKDESDGKTKKEKKN